MQINLRRATIQDVKALSAIASTTFYDTFTGTCTEEDMQRFLYDYYNEGQVQKELADDSYGFYFAEVDNQPVGYLLIKEDYKNLPLMRQWKALELKRIYILKDFQGKGVAQVLMDFAIDYAQQNTYEVLWLGVWEHNSRAQKFYEKYGFENSGHTHDFPIGNTPQTDIWLWKFFNYSK
jgi:ribosomal protein S18 acetylase RimI-like enzyme